MAADLLLSNGCGYRYQPTLRVPTGFSFQSMCPDKAPFPQSRACPDLCATSSESEKAETGLSLQSLLAWRAEEPSSANSEVDSQQLSELSHRERESSQGEG